MACVTEKECYAVLEISSGSDMETVKKAYRRLAFALHPDLNPELPNAARRFQQVNEAYVTLVHLYEKKQHVKKTKSNTEENSGSSGRARREAEKAYSKAQEQQNSHGKTASSKETSNTASHESAKENFASSVSGSSNNFHEAGAKEKVIGDILNDPFAKRVFEDIYKRIQDVTHEKIIRPAAETVLGNKERRKMSSQQGTLVGRLKRWALRQIDDEQVLRLPRERIVPGARVRMQIQHGIASEVQTIEVTLPLEFGPGKTMRLKGLGKRVGSLAGDLYIRIEPI